MAILMRTRTAIREYTAAITLAPSRELEELYRSRSIANLEAGDFGAYLDDFLQSRQQRKKYWDGVDMQSEQFVAKFKKSLRESLYPVTVCETSTIQAHVTERECAATSVNAELEETRTSEAKLPERCAGGADGDNEEIAGRGTVASTADDKMPDLYGSDEDKDAEDERRKSKRGAVHEPVAAAAAAHEASNAPALEPAWAASGSIDVQAAKRRVEALSCAEKARRVPPSAPVLLEDDDEPPGLAVSGDDDNDDDDDRRKSKRAAAAKPAATVVRKKMSNAPEIRSVSGLDALASGLRNAFGKRPSTVRVASTAPVAAAASSVMNSSAPADARVDVSLASGATLPAGSAQAGYLFVQCLLHCARIPTRLWCTRARTHSLFAARRHHAISRLLACSAPATGSRGSAASGRRARPSTRRSWRD